MGSLKLVDGLERRGHSIELLVRREHLATGLDEKTIVERLLSFVQPLSVLEAVRPRHLSLVKLVPDGLRHGSRNRPQRSNRFLMKDFEPLRLVLGQPNSSNRFSGRTLLNSSS